MHPFAGVAQLPPARQLVTGGLSRALDAHGELAGLGRPLVGAGEVADECFSEINPAVDAAGLQAVQPSSGRALEHERNVLHGNALVTVCDADGCRVVDRPFLQLHGAGGTWAYLGEV